MKLTYITFIEGLTVHCFYIFITGPPYKPKDFEVIMETSISVTVRWKAGFAAGFEPQTFRLEYKETTESGSITPHYLLSQS